MKLIVDKDSDALYFRLDESSVIASVIESDDKGSDKGVRFIYFFTSDCVKHNRDLYSLNYKTEFILNGLYYK